MDNLLRELWLAVRTVCRKPSTGVIILTLALGIGINTAIFSVVNAVLLRPFAFAQPDRLVRIWPNGSLPRQGLARLIESTHVYESLAGYGYESKMTLIGHEEPLRLSAVAVSPGFFKTLGVTASAGRLIGLGDEALDQTPVVLSHDLWQSRFGGERGAVGQSILLDGRPYTVVGIAHRSFRFPSRDVEIWFPIRLDEADAQLAWGGQASMQVIGRLRRGVSLEQAQNELKSFLPRIRDAYPWPMSANYGVDAGVSPLRAELLGDLGSRLAILLGAVSLILLIACLNVANLLLARARSRRREIALRAALGGNRWHIFRQLLAESCFLGLAGGAVGLLVAYAGLEILRPFLPADLPHIDDIGIDGRVLAFTFIIALSTALIFGLLPSWWASKTVQESLKEGGRAQGPRTDQRRLSAILVSFEVALAVVVAVGAALLLQTFWNLSRHKLGFQPERLYVANLAPTESRYSDDESRRHFYTQVLERLKDSGLAHSASVASVVPFNDSAFGSAFLIEGQPTPQGADWPFAEAHVVVSSEYLQTLGVPILRGRGFEATDRADAPGVVLISQALAKRYWSNDDPIGKQIGFPGRTVRWFTIVGVVGEARYSAAQEAPTTLYQLLDQGSVGPMWLLARTDVAPAQFAERLRGLVDQLDRDAAISNLQPMERAISDSLGKPRLTAALLVVFSLLALMLGAVGVYGITVNTVTQQAQEMAIRLVLGAKRWQVLWRVIRQTSQPVILGVITGVLLSLLLGRLVAGFLYGVSETDPLTFLAVSLLLVGVAVVASLRPALRATRIAPADTLRAE